MKISISTKSLIIIEGRDKIGDDVIDATESVIQSMKKQFPSVIKKFKGIVFKHINHAEYDIFTNQIWHPIYGLSTLDMADRGADQETSAVIGGYVGSLWHEFGHVIDGFIKLKYKKEPDIQDKWREEKQKLQSVIGHSSEYSKKNLGEWFAERFELEQLGREQKLIIKLINEFL